MIIRKRKIIIISSLTILFIILSFSVVYAYFFQKIENDFEGTFGEVKVDPDLYFMTGETRTEGIYSKIYNDAYSKTIIYEVILANLNDPRHLNNLRIDFKVNSKIDTYFRVKLYDSVVLINAKGDRETVLANTGIKYRFKDYDPDIEYDEDDGDSEFWFLDKSTGWFYYKLPVKAKIDETPMKSTIVEFIFDTTNYEGPTQNRKLELFIKIEAVQADMGPFENWGLETQPWPNGGDW